MPIARLAFAGLLALTVLIVAHAVPLGRKPGAAVSQAPGDRQCWGDRQVGLEHGKSRVSGVKGRDKDALGPDLRRPSLPG